MSNYVDVQKNLEFAIRLVQSEAGNRLRLDTGALLPWERHLARELSPDGGPITLGRTPSRITATSINNIQNQDNIDAFGVKSFD